MFSRNAVVSRFGNVPALMFRITNIRKNQIIEAHMKLTLLRDDETAEGHCYRRMSDLPLARASSLFLGLSWTVMHPITRNQNRPGLSASTKGLGSNLSPSDQGHQQKGKERACQREADLY